MNNLKITKCVVGDLRCNCYLIDNGREALLVDPGDEVEKIIEMIGEKKLIGILLTHDHFDHVGAIEGIVEKFHIPVYCRGNVSEGDITIGTFSFEVIYTPGHAKDSVSYYFPKDKMMFTGDFLFYNTIGRCDLFGSSVTEMNNSIEKIKKYSDDIVVYPGHGKETKLGREKKYNPFF